MGCHSQNEKILQNRTARDNDKIPLLGGSEQKSVHVFRGSKERWRLPGSSREEPDIMLTRRKSQVLKRSRRLRKKITQSVRDRTSQHPAHFWLIGSIDQQHRPLQFLRHTACQRYRPVRTKTQFIWSHDQDGARIFAAAWEPMMQLKHETPVRGKIELASSLPNLPPAMTSVAVVGSVAIMTHSLLSYTRRGGCLAP